MWDFQTNCESKENQAKQLKLTGFIRIFLSRGIDCPTFTSLKLVK